MLDVECHTADGKTTRHVDLGAADSDGSCNQRIAGQSAGDRERAVDGGDEEIAVGIAGVIERDADIGGKSRSRVERYGAVAATDPPAPRLAGALRSLTRSSSIVPMTVIARRRVLLSGSTNSAPCVEKMPRMEGFLRLREMVALACNVPLA